MEFRAKTFYWFRLSRVAILLLFIGGNPAGQPLLFAQVQPAAKKLADVQVGASFDIGSPDYGPSNLYGIGVYTTFDFRAHLGVEGEFHQLDDPNSGVGIYERTYEVGPRYFWRFGRFEPYVKALAGRGVFNFPPDPVHPHAGAAANLGYTIWAEGFGTDYHLRPSVNLRVDYEFQQWPGFPPHGLTPRVFSIGVAYHFH
jgi:hypothetical protein